MTERLIPLRPVEGRPTSLVPALSWRQQSLAVCEAVDHQGEGEVEPVVALAGGELGGVAGGVGEGLGGEGGEPA